jgi:UDP-N-acetylmuramoyl-tripeptide--D-alanyl-D-alanine ligase
MEVRRPRTGPALVVDCYNANPTSTEAALRALAGLGRGHKVALLGLMAELGSASESEHRRMAELARELGIDVVGYRTAWYGARQVDTVEEAVDLAQGLTPADAWLLKGSRVARLEEVLAAYGRAIGDDDQV